MQKRRLAAVCVMCAVFSILKLTLLNRAEKDHTNWLEDAMQCQPAQAKKLVLGWRELGILNEKRFASLIKHGGMFESDDWEVDYV